MNVPDFLTPRLVGDRFEGHSIPLELLGDLAVLEAMIIEVAKWRYLKENSQRTRSPRKFTQGISLTLTAVEEGSAVARIALVLATDGLVAPQQVYFEQSRDAVIGAIAAVGDDEPPTAHLPRKALAYFDRLGRSLRDNEAIEFTTPTRPSPARLTKETRLRLLEASQVNERTEEIQLRGGVFDFNKEDMTFKLMLPDGAKVDGPVVSQHFETFNEAHYGYEKGVKVLLEGVGKYNRADKLQYIESVEHVTLLDPLDLPSQLQELKQLRDGWYDGKGYAPSAEGLDWLAKVVNERYPDNLALPYVYPVAEGGVRLEWTLLPNEISLEINLQDHLGEWHQLNLETDVDEARSLNLDRDSDWDWILNTLQSLGGATS